MSSKIYGHDDSATAEPINWQQVGAGQSPGGDPHGRQGSPEQEMEGRARQAHQAGYEEGLAAARNEAARELQSLAERVAHTVAELADFRPALRRQAEGDLLKLALAIARRILYREVAVDPDAMRGIIRAALEKLSSQEVSRVRVHPGQEQTVRAELASRGIAVVGDPNLERGAVLFETARGSLDASLETQLCEIEMGLTDRLRRK